MENKFVNIDKEIVEKLKNGNSNAFEKLYRNYSSRLFYFSLKYLRDKEEAEELVQEIFVKIWEMREDLDPEKSFNSFIFTVTKNTILNKLKKRKHEQNYAEHLKLFLISHHNKTETDLYLHETQRIINKTVETMPLQRKTIFILSRENGLSYKEISEKLQIGEKTIETHIRLALKTLRSVLISNEIIIPFLFFLSFF